MVRMEKQKMGMEIEKRQQEDIQFSSSSVGMKSKNMEGKEKRRKGGKEAGENFRAE